PISDYPTLDGASVVIWTTTPWTIPGNRAIAFSKALQYGLYEVEALEEGAFATVGEKLFLADQLAPAVAKHARISLKRIASYGDVGNLVCGHPFRAQGYEFQIPLLPGEYVTSDTGTGFVHTAPGHGED